MSWLRIDDTFGDHPKLLMLTRAERWSFVELLCYCAQHRTEGYFPHTIGDTRSGLKTRLLNKFLEVGLVDRTPSGELVVHDFDHYNPPTADPTGRARQQRWRNAQRNGERNGDVTETVTADVTASRACIPSPSTRPEEQKQKQSQKPAMQAVVSFAAPAYANADYLAPLDYLEQLEQIGQAGLETICTSEGLEP